MSSSYWRIELARCRVYHEPAIHLNETALALARDRGDTWSIAFALSLLGRLAWLQGEHPRATHLQRESLTLQREMDARVGIADSFDVLARVGTAAGEPARAARSLG